MNLAIWDVESSSSSTSFGSIIEIGGILVDENFVEKDRFNFRCRLPEGEIPQAMALIVNKTGVDLLTKANLSHYQMLGEVEKVFSNIPGELISRSDLKHILKEPGNSYIETLYPDYCFLLEQNHIIYPKHLQAELKGYHGGLTEEELKIPIIEIHNF